MPEVGTEVKVDGMSQPAVVNVDGMYLFGNDGKKVRLQGCLHVFPPSLISPDIVPPLLLFFFFLLHTLHAHACSSCMCMLTFSYTPHACTVFLNVFTHVYTRLVCHCPQWVTCPWREALDLLLVSCDSCTCSSSGPGHQLTIFSNSPLAILIPLKAPTDL